MKRKFYYFFYLLLFIFQVPFLYAQQGIKTLPEFKYTVKYKFTDEWQYLSTDMYLFNSAKFNHLINDIAEKNSLNYGKKWMKKKKKNAEFIEYLMLTANIKDVKFFGGDLTYPIYNFQVKPDKLLLLMPHCLQNNECDVKITGDVHRCKKCGKCEIKELVELADHCHVELSVATGGTIARRIVVEKRPELIIAVACERDLTSGIQDSYPIPVYGILNERPFGPCFNTQVDMTKVKEAMKAVLNSHM